MLDGGAVRYVGSVEFMLRGGTLEEAFVGEVVGGDKKPVRFPLFGGPNEGELINPVPDAVLLEPLIMLVEVVARVLPLLVIAMIASEVNVGDVRPTAPAVVLLKTFEVFVQGPMNPVPEAVLLEPLMMLVKVVSRMLPLVMMVAIGVDELGGLVGVSVITPPV